MSDQKSKKKEVVESSEDDHESNSGKDEIEDEEISEESSENESSVESTDGDEDEDDENVESDQEEIMLSPRTANRADATKLYFRAIEIKERKPKNYFVVMYFDKKRVYKSKTTKKTTEWSDQGRFLNVSEGTKSIKISLFQKGLLKSPRGSIILNVDDLIEEYPYNRWYKLEGKKPKKGYLHLQIMIASQNQKIAREFTHPLHTFIENKRLDLFKLAVDEEFTNLTTTDSKGKSALHLAVENDDFDCLKLLLKAMDPKVAIKLQDNDGNSVLHTACLHNAKREIIEALLNAKFDSSAVNKRKETPLHSAAEGDNVPAIELLVSKGAKVNTVDQDKLVPLATALLKHSPNAIKTLIRLKTNVYKKDNKDMSVWELAQRRDMVNTEPRKVFMEELNAHDPREFLERKQFGGKKVAFGKKISIDFLESTQFTITVEKKTDVSIMIAAPDLSGEFVSHSGFALAKCQQGVHNEPDFSRDTIGFGGINPLRETLDPDYFYTIIPSVKGNQYEGGYVLLVLFNEDDDCTITELKPWKYAESIEGRWDKENSGGALHNTSWTQNQKYDIELPEKDNVRFLVYLAQERDDPELRVPDDGELRKIPYDHNIGFIVLDKNDKVIDQTEKFVNARGVHKEFVLNCSKSNQWKIVPATWNPGNESEYTIRLYCDEPVNIKRGS